MLWILAAPNSNNINVARVGETQPNLFGNQLLIIINRAVTNRFCKSTRQRCTKRSLKIQLWWYTDCQSLNGFSTKVEPAWIQIGIPGKSMGPSPYTVLDSSKMMTMIN